VLGAKRAVHAAFNAFGLEISRYRPRGEYARKRLRVLQSGRVDTLLDIGANYGHYAAALRAQGFAGRIVSFEPVAAAFAGLSQRAAGDPNWHCHELALGDEDAERTIHVSADVTSSSLLPPAEAYAEASPRLEFVREETVSTTTLDAVRGRLFDADDALFLKLDVQGFELEVLRGAEQTLGQAVGLECELSLAPIYEGQALFTDVIRYLADRGFHLRALEPVFLHQVTGELLQLDGLFTRRRDDLTYAGGG
jgi:FkbM family methyltransferase